jgi:hypothetical protein
MTKRSKSYGFEADNPDDPEALAPGAGDNTMTVKDTAGNDVVVVITASQARAWWATVPPKGQLPYRSNFINPNAPTDDELITAYGEAHEPATPERANAWWDSLSPAERKAHMDNLVSRPEDDDLVKLYDTAHALETPTALTEDTPPKAQPATPGASATNPDLMPNDAVPIEEVPLYAGMPRRPNPPTAGHQPGQPQDGSTARGTERMRNS